MSFFDEIKRRNVIRVAAAYAVVGWLILKVADIVLDFAGAPDWVGKGVIALLIVGFIPAIILAWLFEVTPDGVKRDDGKSDVADNARSQRLDKITIGAVVVLAGMFLWQQFSPLKPTRKMAPDSSSAAVIVTELKVSDASIAALPFADFSPDGDQEYFSDGISEEILNVLVRVDGLSVASRTSAFAFKG